MNDDYIHEPTKKPIVPFEKDESLSDKYSVNDSRRNLIPTESEKTPEEETFKCPRAYSTIWLIIGILGCFSGVLILLTYHFLMLNSEKGFEGVFVAQPFTEANEFKSFTLSNGLKVLLVQPNEGLKHSYVSLTVGVGSESDPEDFIGFTHLIEHLLFTGSVKFPEDNYIEKIVNKYHGENNGVTKAFTTSYYYSLEAEGFEEFSEVLVDAVRQPLFASDTILKEINNVNSEISMRMTFNKNLGYYKLIKAIGNKECKMFSDGFANIDPETVDIEKLRKRILAFHDKYYSSNIMTLTVISEEHPDELRRIIEREFIVIPNKEIERPLYNDKKNYAPPFDDETKNKIFYMKGFSEPTTLSMVFTVNSEKNSSKFHPMLFFSTFFNYESEMSLKQTLIKEDYITGMDDEIVLSDYVTALYIVSFDLTAYGKKNMSKIITKFLQFVEFVKGLKNKKDTFDSLAKISKYSFFFNLQNSSLDFGQIENNPFDRALLFSEILQDHTPDEVFTLDSILKNFDEESFNEFLNKLNMMNSIFMVESPDFNVVNKEKPEEAKEENTEETKAQMIAKLIEEMKKKQNTRLLEGTEELYSSSQNFDLTISTFYDTFFDNSIKTMDLDQQFDFDGGRPYTSRSLPVKALQWLTSKKESADVNYDVIENLNTDYMDSYSMITTCKPPLNLRKNSSSANGNMIISKKIDFDFVADNELFRPIDTKRIFDVYFQPTTQDNRMYKLQLLRDLTVFKYCLVRDFYHDDRIKEANVVYESESTDVYHKLYRKTLQPKYITILEIESEFTNNEVVHSPYDNKINTLFKLEMFCLYLTKHIELKFHKEYMKGNEFGCRVSNYNIVFEFEGISQELNQFVDLIIEYLGSFKDDDIYDEQIITNLKRRIINKYTDFDSKTSLKASMYYLGLAVDKLFIDYSSEDKLDNLNKKINLISKTDLADVMKEVSDNNKITLIYVGNVSNMDSFAYSKKIGKSLGFNYGKFAKDIQLENFRKYMMEKLVIKLNYNDHYMVRLPNINPEETNNVYLSYFNVGILPKKEKILAMVMIHYFKNKIFDRMRNQLNLGYVAHAGLRMFYHVG